jgi:hypothetical protein
MTTAQKKRALRAQIRAKKAIKFTYQHDPKGSDPRTGNPHTLGISTTEKWAVRIYQTNGPSTRGLVGNNSPEDFRFFLLEDIDGIVEQSTEFEVHPAFKKGDKLFSKIDVEVQK